MLEFPSELPMDCAARLYTNVRARKITGREVAQDAWNLGGYAAGQAFASGAPQAMATGPLDDEQALKILEHLKADPAARPLMAAPIPWMSLAKWGLTLFLKALT